MNTIEALLHKSIYHDAYHYINYFIDGYFLDERIEELYPDNLYGGSIPTLTYGMEIPGEDKVVWNRIFPAKNEKTICPILMCPNDRDFSCTLIVAEIINNGNYIEWKRIGVDKTKDTDPEKVGIDVEWFDQIDSHKFEKDAYYEMLIIFKNQYKNDQQNANSVD